MLWYLKQLLPLAYRSIYGMDGERHFVAWKMWFGRCYAIEDHVIKE